MRLIDADSLIDAIECTWWESTEAYLCAEKLVNQQPTINAVKRGRWEEHCEIVQGLSGCDGSVSVVEYEKDFLMCSECNEIVEYASNFCPHCGVRMDGDENA